jgi:hypothetical protein
VFHPKLLRPEEAFSLEPRQQKLSCKTILKQPILIKIEDELKLKCKLHDYGLISRFSFDVNLISYCYDGELAEKLISYEF